MKCCCLLNISTKPILKTKAFARSVSILLIAKDNKFTKMLCSVLIRVYGRKICPTSIICNVHKILINFNDTANSVECSTSYVLFISIKISIKKLEKRTQIAAHRFSFAEVKVTFMCLNLKKIIIFHKLK